jgi:hypothetical protein
MGHFIQKSRQFFYRKRCLSSAFVVGAVPKINDITFFFVYLKLSHFQHFANLFGRSVGFDGLGDLFFLFQEVSIPENEQHATQGINGHDSSQKEAQIAVNNPH